MRTFMRGYGLMWLLLFGVLLPAAAQDPPEYFGNDAMCGTCHTPNPLDPTTGIYPGAPPVDFDAYMDSGHPWKIHRTFGNEPAVDEWPHTPVPPLPTVDGTQLTWSDVEYVIGNFFWKARFIDRDGYIWTGTANDLTQWNLGSRGVPQGFVAYHAGDVDKPFDCGRCHTTGYDRSVYDADPNDPAGHQHGLPGLIGTWSEDGVRCEACHGPSALHVAAPTDNHPPGGKGCSDCHYRDADFRMPWKGGFMRHHQQGEDFSHSPHRDLQDGCMACHDPHRSAVYDDGGVTAECTDCHNAQSHQVNIPEMANVACTKCHMPLMGKSAANSNDHKADVHGHLFRIMTEAKEAWENVVDADGNPIAEADIGNGGFWAQDADENSAATLDYACLGCHDDEDVAWAAEHAAGIHTSPEPPTDTWEVTFPITGADGFTVTFTPFASYLMVETTNADGSTSYGIGFEFNGLIIWIRMGTMDIFIGSINRTDGTMLGSVWGGPNDATMFLGQAQL